jgi:SAM-dependent methyltransferase
MDDESPGGFADAPSASRPEYGNWVSTRFVVGPVIGAAVLFVLAIAARVFRVDWLFFAQLGAAALVALVAVYFAYARHLLAADGGEVQARVQQLVLDHLDWDGRSPSNAASGAAAGTAADASDASAGPGEALDIGCGNGPLTIALAKRFSGARVTGIDFWGESWEYSQDVCETNAANQGVGERTTFRQASAADLPFADGSFTAVVSNLCFHEVRDARDKRELLREALRVLEPGGAFAFQDLFRLKGVFGPVDDLVATVRGWGIQSVDYLDTGASDFIPKALRPPFMVGSMGVLHGRK